MAGAAIFFEPEGYSISLPQLMGRHAAGHGFLHGYLCHGQVERFHAYTLTQAQFPPFLAAAREAGVTRPVENIQPRRMDQLAMPGCLYLPEPRLASFAWQRRFFDERAWSLCGVTHTTLTARAMDAITGLVSAPVQPWDALICTSRSVRATVEVLLAAEEEHIASRHGATRFPRLKLPIIPLGVDTGVFAYKDGEKSLARTSLGISEDQVVVLFLGRLSYHAKAHPASLYASLAQAQAQTSRRLVLIECGWFANESIKSAFAAAAALLAPGVHRIVLDGRDAVNRKTAWAAADIFASLTDNLQETFGITPVEAMAAGLPVVITDWNGYRETVRDGIDGFLVPTATPPVEHGRFLAINHALGVDNYDHYCGQTSQLVSVDIAAAVERFCALINDPSLRQRMGEAGQQRARGIFDWRHIIARYQELWAELGQERRHAASGGRSNPNHPWPARMDPFAAFATYPTRHLTGDSYLVRVPELDRGRIDEIRALTSFALADRMVPRGDSFHAVLAFVPTDRAIRIRDVPIPTGMTAERLMASLALGLKIGALAIVPMS